VTGFLYRIITFRELTVIRV